MNRDFLVFVLKKTLAEGECWSSDQVGDHLDSRERVDPASLAIKAAVVERFQSISKGDDYLLVTVRIIDEDGAVYLAHLNTQWDLLFSAYAHGQIFTPRDLVD